MFSVVKGKKFDKVIYKEKSRENMPGASVYCCVDAEGNIIDKEIVIFKDMQIGDQRRQNVEVVVVKNVDYKFIINRTGLRQFGEYEFDKQRSKLIFFDE